MMSALVGSGLIMLHRQWGMWRASDDFRGGVIHGSVFVSTIGYVARYDEKKTLLLCIPDIKNKKRHPPASKPTHLLLITLIIIQRLQILTHIRPIQIIP